MNDFHKSIIIFFGFSFFIFLFFIIPYFIFHNELASKLISIELKNNITSLIDSIDKINNVTIDMKYLLKTLNNNVISNYLELDKYIEMLQSTESEKLLNYTHRITPPNFFPTYLKCSTITNSINWTHCNVDIFAKNIADKVFDNSIPIFSNFSSLYYEEYISHLNEYDDAFNNISKMSNGLINFSHPTDFDYNKCLIKLNDINQFFKNINNMDGCNLLQNLDKVNREIAETNLRLLIYSTLFKKDYNTNISEFWPIIGNSKQLDDFIRYPTIVPSFSSYIQEIQNEGKIIEDKIQSLEAKFEELEIPYIGNFSFTLESVIILFPIGASIGFTICCYLFKKQLPKENVKLRDYFLILILGIYTIIICVLTFFIIFNLLNAEIKQYIIPDAVSINNEIFVIILIIVISIWGYAMLYIRLPHLLRKILQLSSKKYY